MEEEKAMEMSTGSTGTVPKMFWHGVQTRASRTIFRQKEFGIWKSVSWEALGCAAYDTDRASEIINRILDHIKKAPPPASL